MKKAISLFLALTLCAGLAVPTLAADVIDSGACGDNVVWTLDNDGVLTISDWYAYIEEVLAPEMGYAPTSGGIRTVPFWLGEDPEAALPTEYIWDGRSGIIGADVLDFTGDGNEDMILYYLAPEETNSASSILYARLYTRDAQGNVIRGIPLSTEYGDGAYDAYRYSVRLGVMEINGTPYLYVERYDSCGFAKSGSIGVNYTWYMFDGTRFSPCWEFAGGDSIFGSSASLRTYTAPDNYTEQRLWQDQWYNAPGAPLLGSDAAKNDALKLCLQLIGVPEAAIAIVSSDDSWGSWPTCSGTELVKDSVRFLFTNDDSGEDYYTRRMEFSFTVAEDVKLPKTAVPAVGVLVNGNPVRWTDVAPFIDENDRTMVPLRAVADAMGLTVGWDDTTRTANFTDGTMTIFFPIDGAVAYTTEGAVEMDTAAVIVNDRTYAPVRYLAQYFGYVVDWDEVNRNVLLMGGRTTEKPEFISFVIALNGSETPLDIITRRTTWAPVDLDALIYAEQAWSCPADWYSTDERVCVVDQDGVVTAVGYGACKIVAVYGGMETGVTVYVPT